MSERDREFLLGTYGDPQAAADAERLNTLGTGRWKSEAADRAYEQALKDANDYDGGGLPTTINETTPGETEQVDFGGDEDSEQEDWRRTNQDPSLPPTSPAANSTVPADAANSTVPANTTVVSTSNEIPMPAHDVPGHAPSAGNVGLAKGGSGSQERTSTQRTSTSDTQSTRRVHYQRLHLV